jgi:hypothetical protein
LLKVALNTQIFLKINHNQTDRQVIEDKLRWEVLQMNQMKLYHTCESSAPFFVIYKAGREPTPYWW